MQGKTGITLILRIKIKVFNRKFFILLNCIDSHVSTFRLNPFLSLDTKKTLQLVQDLNNIHNKHMISLDSD